MEESGELPADIVEITRKNLIDYVVKGDSSAVIESCLTNSEAGGQVLSVHRMMCPRPPMTSGDLVQHLNLLDYLMMTRAFPASKLMSPLPDTHACLDRLQVDGTNSPAEAISRQRVDAAGLVCGERQLLRHLTCYKKRCRDVFSHARPPLGPQVTT